MSSRTLASAVTVVVWLVATAARAQTSESYAVDRATVSGGGGTAASASFETTVVVAQDTPEGASSLCGGGYSVSAGFWSVLGDVPAPIDLRLGRAAAPPRVLLSWTGNAGTFELYRSSTPDDVLDPVHLHSLHTDCEATDALGGPPGAIVFYNVVDGD
jgi:hypothetical protein